MELKISASLSSVSTARAGMPFSNAAASRFKNSTSPAKDLSPFNAFADLSNRRCTISKSAKISSMLIMSISRFGSTEPST